MMVVERRLQELYAEFACARFWNLRLTQVDDVGGVTERIDQNGTHVRSFANRSRLSGGLSTLGGGTCTIRANCTSGAGGPLRQRRSQALFQVPEKISGDRLGPFSKKDLIAAVAPSLVLTRHTLSRGGRLS